MALLKKTWKNIIIKTGLRIGGKSILRPLGERLCHLLLIIGPAACCNNAIRSTRNRYFIQS